MAKVNIPKENIDFIRLDLSRHYLQVDCDFTVYIVLNPNGVDVPTDGTDICSLHIGAWQIDTWSFLTDKFTKNTPGFSACLVWDKTLETDISKAPRVAESDIDSANSISSLKGQPVNITGFSLASGKSLPVKTLDSDFCHVKNYPGTSLAVENYPGTFLAVENYPGTSLAVKASSVVLKVGMIFKDEYRRWVYGSDGNDMYVFARSMFGTSPDAVGIDDFNSFRAENGYFNCLSNGSSYSGMIDLEHLFVTVTINEDNIITAMKIRITVFYVVNDELSYLFLSDF